MYEEDSSVSMLSSMLAIARLIDQNHPSRREVVSHCGFDSHPLSLYTESEVTSRACVYKAIVLSSKSLSPFALHLPND